MNYRNFSLSLLFLQSSIVERLNSFFEPFVLILKPSLNLKKIFFYSLGNLTNEGHISSERSDSVHVGNRQFDRKNRFSNFKESKNFKRIVVGVLAFILLAGVAKAIKGINLSSSADKAEVKGAKASYDLNKEFVFPLRNSAGDTVSELKYLVEKVELRDEIIVKGQRANSVKGRTFLIVTLKITNDFSSPIEINTKDYIRLSINGNEEEWLAPDIHNDPVEIQAISTKYTRVGFAVNDVDTNLVLRVGEINGNKEKFPLEF